MSVPVEVNVDVETDVVDCKASIVPVEIFKSEKSGIFLNCSSKEGILNLSLTFIKLSCCFKDSELYEASCRDIFFENQMIKIIPKIIIVSQRMIFFRRSERPRIFSKEFIKAFRG
jgi:hypothetical protein